MFDLLRKTLGGYTPAKGTDDGILLVEVTNPSGGGSGGATTIADGSDVATGAKADAAYAGTGSASVISILKGIFSGLVATISGQRVKRLTSAVTFTLSASTARAQGSLLSGLVGIQTTATPNSFVTITSVSIASSFGAASPRAQFSCYAFNSSSPAGLSSNADNSTFTLSNQASANAASIGVIGGLLNNSGSSSYGYQMSGLSAPIQVDAASKYYLAFVLNAAYTNATNEQFAVSSNWAE